MSVTTVEIPTAVVLQDTHIIREILSFLPADLFLPICKLWLRVWKENGLAKLSEEVNERASFHKEHVKVVVNDFRNNSSADDREGLSKLNLSSLLDVKYKPVVMTAEQENEFRKIPQQANFLSHDSGIWTPPSTDDVILYEQKVGFTLPLELKLLYEMCGGVAFGYFKGYRIFSFAEASEAFAEMEEYKRGGFWPIFYVDDANQMFHILYDLLEGKVVCCELGASEWQLVARTTWIWPSVYSCLSSLGEFLADSRESLMWEPDICDEFGDVRFGVKVKKSVGFGMGRDEAHEIINGNRIVMRLILAFLITDD